MTDTEKKYLEKIGETFDLLQQGWPPAPLPAVDAGAEPEFGRLFERINRFLESHREMSEALGNLAQGKLDFALPMDSDMAALQLIGSLQSSLLHLTTITQQIAGGDFSQKVNFMGDFSTAFNRMTSQLQTAFHKIEQQNRRLREAFELLEQEKEKSDLLLLNILPPRVAANLKSRGSTPPEKFDAVSVLFSDIVGFTRMSAWLEPGRLIDELNDMFTAFDAIIAANRGERIKTIGDAYLAVAGMNEPCDDHAACMVRSALEMIAYIEQRNRTSQLQWQIRIGIHTGRIVGGVVGVRKYIYDVFGDAVNTACRMEQHSEPMRVNVSEAVFRKTCDQFDYLERGRLEVKGKGRIGMYFVEGPCGSKS